MPPVALSTSLYFLLTSDKVMVSHNFPCPPTVEEHRVLPNQITSLVRHLSVNNTQRKIKQNQKKEFTLHQKTKHCYKGSKHFRISLQRAPRPTSIREWKDTSAEAMSSPWREHESQRPALWHSLLNFSNGYWAPATWWLHTGLWAW